MPQLIVFDMEWNMGYAPRTFRYQGAEQTLRGEIIQIGAARVEAGRITDTFTVLIRPKIFPKLHHHVAKVTGLTQKDLAAGVPLAEGLRRFMDWCGPDAALGEWGQDDVPVLKQNLVLAGLDESWPRTWYDLQRAFLSQRPRAEGESMTLESVVERLGLEKDEAFHDALADAVYTARVCLTIDLDKALAEYPGEERQLEELLCPPDKKRSGFTLWRGYVDGEAWLTSAEMRRAACPVCGAPLAPDPEDWWLRKGNNSLCSMGSCPAHGPVMIWLRRMRSDGLHHTFARATEPADEALTARWQKEKKAALARAKRRAEREAAEAAAAAAERVKNAGR